LKQKTTFSLKLFCFFSKNKLLRSIRYR